MAATSESWKLIQRSLALTDAHFSRRTALRGAMAGAGVAAFAATGVSALAQATPETSEAVATPFDGPLADEQLLRVPMSEPVTMDPGASTGFDELAIFFNIYDGLTRVDQQTGEIVGAVAESWDVSEDVTEFTFHLKAGAQWSDGTPLTANDFVYSWRRVLDPNTLSEYVPAMFYLLNGEEIANGEAELESLGVEAVDDQTLKVTLSDPLAFFPLVAATWTYLAVPQHVIDEHGDSWTNTGETGISNGPYVMESWEHDQKIVLVANPNYTTGDPVTIQRAEYSIFKDPTTQAYIAFENDELDYAAPEGPDLDRVLADPEAAAQLIRFPLSNCNFIATDTRGEFTGQIPFRQALYKAVNRDDLVNIVLRAQYVPATTIVSPDIPGSLMDQSPIAENVDEAKQLLVDAGIDPSAVTIEITYQNSPARVQTVAEYLQATWQEVLGISVTLAPIEEATYTDWRAARETQGFDVYTGSWGSDFADPSNWHNQNFTSSANHYRTHWLNEEYDSLAGEALVTADVAERNALYQQAETILVEEASIIPLYRGLAARAVKPVVKDIYLQPTLSFVHLRTIKIAAE